MKHFLLSPEGLQRIADKDVASWLSQGNFMKAEGTVMFPSALGSTDAEQIELLLKKACNFTYWFTPDYRVTFTTKDGRGWKIRFEVRGVGKSGKAAIQMERTDGKVQAHGVIKMIAEVFQRYGADVVAPVAPPNQENARQETPDREAIA